MGTETQWNGQQWDVDRDRMGQGQNGNWIGVTMGWDKDGDTDVNKGSDCPGMVIEQEWGQGHSGGCARVAGGCDMRGDTEATGATHRSKRRFCRSSKQ